MRVRWLHVETGGDPQLPTHGPKVFVARAVNTPTKYSHHIGNLAGLPLAFSDRTFTFLTGVALSHLSRRIGSGDAPRRGFAAREPSAQRFRRARSRPPSLWFRPNARRQVCVIPTTL